MKSTIKTGDKLLISELAAKPRGKARPAEHDEEAVEFVSQVEEVVSAVEIVALAPISNRQLVKLPVSARYRAKFYTFGGIVSYTMEVMSYFKEDDLFFMRIKLVSPPEQLNNRQFFRLDCTLPLKYTIMRDGDADGEGIEDEDQDQDSAEFDENVECEGLIRDISGGGMRFLAHAKLTPGRKIHCKVFFGNNLLIVVGTVLVPRGTMSPSNIENSSGFKHENYVSFTGITKQDQEKLVKFIFSEQRALLKVIR